MTDGDGTPSVDAYSPQRRTALVLTGTGTAGAYHAGVLRALHEAGVKIDIVAARGIGVVGALFAAIDGAPRLWDERGFWRSSFVRGLYPWRGTLRGVVWALAAALAIIVIPIAAVALGLVVFPIDFVLQMIGLSGGGLTGGYLRVAERAFSPTGFPTWLPRLAVLVLGTMATLSLVSGAEWTRRRRRGAFWWRILTAPVMVAPAVDHVWTSLWELLRGATQLKEPRHGDLGRRFTELVSENLGQPGFRELLIVTHDVDAQRDLVCALVAEPRRRELLRRQAGEGASEILDLAGLGRDHLADVVAASLAIPLATEYHQITFAPDSYWRGERHRLVDRPASLPRIVEELSGLGVEQIVLVSAAPVSPGPHALGTAPIDGLGQLGEWIQSAEAAAVRDVVATAELTGAALFLIAPRHNPLGPFDFSGTVDDRSERVFSLPELMHLGYEDAHHQFVEPIIGDSGDRVGGWNFRN